VGDDRLLRISWSHIAAVMVVAGVLAAPGHAVSSAAAQSTSPDKLWDAYPLEPGQKGAEPPDPAPTPTAAPQRRTGSPARAASQGGGGSVLVPVLVGVGVAAFAAGLSVGALRRRRRAIAAPAGPPVNVSRPAPAAPPVIARHPAPPEPAPVTWTPPTPATAAPAPRPDPPRPPVRRFAPKPWPEEAKRAWTCEIVWKSGYIKSGFRAMAAAPGDPKRRVYGQSRPINWMLMDAPEPPTTALVEALRELVDALTRHGWVRIGPAGPWYSQRFLWAGEGQPRPLAPQKGKEANV
jgi:hypothetical protein